MASDWLPNLKLGHQGAGIAGTQAGSGRELGAGWRRATAVTVFNDRCATGVLDVLHRAGLTVPGDISVIGYDDSRLARLSHVNLTTVAQDAEQMTTLAVTRAIDRVNGTPVNHRELVIPPRLVVRGTTAAVGTALD